MKYEDIEKVKEIINGIDEIDNFLKSLQCIGSEIILTGASKNILASIQNSDTLIAIGQALNIRRDELIKEFESL